MKSNKLTGIIKRLAYKAGILLQRRESWMDNYLWLQTHNILSIIDIGANEGQFALWAGEYFPAAGIHSFEPVYGSYLRLCKKTEHLNIETYNMGLGDKKIQTEINITVPDYCSSVLEPDKILIENYPNIRKTGRELIQINRLDDILNVNNLNRNILIKIDAQGFEDKIISGGQNIICKSKIAIVEMSFSALYKDQPLFHDIYNIFTGLGFHYRGILGAQYHRNFNGEPLFFNGVFFNNNI